MRKNGNKARIANEEKQGMLNRIQRERRQMVWWSHRAIYGFAIGDTVKEGDCVADYLPIGFTAKTKADCKKMAIAFARSVS
jgi:hypothetical protein